MTGSEHPHDHHKPDYMGAITAGTHVKCYSVAVWGVLAAVLLPHVGRSLGVVFHPWLLGLWPFDFWAPWLLRSLAHLIMGYWAPRLLGTSAPWFFFCYLAIPDPPL